MKRKAVPTIAIVVAANHEQYCSTLQTSVAYTKLPTTFVGEGSYGKSRIKIRSVEMPDGIGFIPTAGCSDYL